MENTNDKTAVPKLPSALMIARGDPKEIKEWGDARAEEARQEAATAWKEAAQAWERHALDAERQLAATQRTAGGDAVCDNCDGKGGWKTGEWIDPVSGPECEVERCEVCEGTGKLPVAEAAAQADDASEEQRRETWKDGYSVGFEAAKSLFAAPTAQPTALDDERALFDQFNREDLESVADGLEAGYEKTVDVGGSPFDGPNLVESSTAYAARFIRAALRQPGAVDEAEDEDHGDSRAYTAEEVRTEFIGHVQHLAFYWSRQEGTPRELLEGLAHSILCIFDGVTALPAFDIVLAPHPDDKQYHIENGDNWYEQGMVINDCRMHEELAALAIKQDRKEPE